MKRRLVLVIALCGYVAACHQSDTDSPKKWPRTIEPQLSVPTEWRPCRALPLEGERVVPLVRCGPLRPRPKPPKNCAIDTRDQALRVLHEQPDCIDHAIAVLTQSQAYGDLAAAYYVRSQRDDSPVDLLAALQAADKGTPAAPALFNQALLRETLGLTDDALASWNAYLDQSTIDAQWREEARTRRDALERRRERNASTQWTETVAQLDVALRAADRASVATLIAPFPANAERYLLNELLPDHIDRARLLAEELRRLSGDRFLFDVVETLARATPPMREVLREGHCAYSVRHPEAGGLLRRGGSPLAMLAELTVTAAIAADPTRAPRAFAMIESLLAEARRKRYPMVVARIRMNRAHLHYLHGRYLESLIDYEAAAAVYHTLRDDDNLLSIHFRRAGVLRDAGQYDLSWRACMQARRYADRVFETQSLHLFLGETASTAAAVGYPSIARRYQSAAIRLIQRQLAAAPPDDQTAIARLRGNLSVARRELAEILLQLEDYDVAQRELAEAIRLLDAEKPADQGRRQSLQVRLAEVQGRMFLRRHEPALAEETLTRALVLTPKEQLRNVRATLHTLRAEARLERGNVRGAEEDLQLALSALREEESQLLAQRRRGEGEALWRAYFGRFQATHRMLIRLRLETNRVREAFAAAENARAFEPLHLIRQLPFAPEPFRRDEPIALERIQKELPPETVLVEYAVLDDRVYVWIITSDRFEPLTLPVSRRLIEQWSESALRAGSSHDTNALHAVLDDAYEKLVDTVLASIGPIQETTRLVFIPDGPMYGIPFAALRNRRTGEYMIEQAMIESAGSAALYLFSLLRDRSFAAVHPSILLFGDPAFDPKLPFANRLRRLPGAREEVTRIGPMYAPAEKKLGADATAPTFLALAPQHTIVHVAAHGIANARAPHQSLLLLAPAPPHTGVLDVQQLLSLRLERTRLVVLSACRSAGGLPIGPEGVGPLVRPFTTAGVPAVIGSLWDVEDPTAVDLFVSFHRDYRQSGDAAKALRHAQLELLQNKRTDRGSVLAWAPFQVIGHSSSPFAPRR